MSTSPGNGGEIEKEQKTVNKEIQKATKEYVEARAAFEAKKKEEKSSRAEILELKRLQKRALKRLVRVRWLNMAA